MSNYRRSARRPATRARGLFSAIAAAALLMATAGSATAAPATSSPAAQVGDAQPAGPSAAYPGTMLPMRSFTSLAVSDAGGHVFALGLDGTANHGTIAATDLDGADPVVVPDSDGAIAMALTPDESTLYVTLLDHRLLEVDTTTLTGTVHDLGTSVCPGGVAIASDQVYFVDSCDDTQELASWSPTGGTIDRVALAENHVDLHSEGPGDPHRVLVDLNDDQFGYDEFDAAADGSLTEVVATHNDDSAPRHPVVSDDGRFVFGEGEFGEVEYRHDTLRPVDSLPAAQDDTVAFAQRSDGATAVGSRVGSNGPHSSYDLYVYAPGSTHPAASYLDDTIATDGLAFGRSSLYLVTNDDTGDGLDPSLHVFTHPLSGDDTTRSSTGSPNAADLPLLDYSSFVVDEAAGRVFLDGGDRDNGVVVTDLTGRHAVRIPDLPAPGTMALSPDGRYLYVPLELGEAVARIDVRTLAVTKIDTGPGTAPAVVAVAGGRVWVTSLGAPITATGPLSPAPAATTLLAVPRHGSLLDAYDENDPAGLITLRATGSGLHSVLEAQRTIAIGDNADAFALSPDAAHVVIAHDGPDNQPPEGITEQAATTGQEQRVFDLHAQVRPTTVAFRDDGLLAVGDGYVHQDDYRYAQLFPGATGRDAHAVDLGRPNDISDLAFGARDLYAVVDHAGSPSTVRLKVVHLPAPAPLTVNADAAVYRQHSQATITAHRDVTTRGAASSAARRVCLLRRGHHHGVQLGCRRIGAHGWATFHSDVATGEHFVLTTRGPGPQQSASLTPIVGNPDHVVSVD